MMKIDTPGSHTVIVSPEPVDGHDNRREKGYEADKKISVRNGDFLPA